MSTLGRSLRDRLLPAVLTAAGVTLLAAGLLSYSGSAAAAGPRRLGRADDDHRRPVGRASPCRRCRRRAPRPRAAAVRQPSPNPNRVATRVVDRGARDRPADHQAPRRLERLPALQRRDVPRRPAARPAGRRKATYLYAHARDGMFGPIYERAIQKKHGGPKSMIGMIVQVYTNDDLLYEYQITKVLPPPADPRRRRSARRTEQLWLQTSEGPKGTPGKTQVVAEPLLTLPADHATANPTPHPVVCG